MSLKLAALKMMKTFISPEQIEEITTDLLNTAIQAKENVVLNDGEAEVVAMFYEIEGEVVFTVAILNEQNTIVRFENTQKVKDLVQVIIKNI